MPVKRGAASATLAALALAAGVAAQNPAPVPLWPDAARPAGAAAESCREGRAPNDRFVRNVHVPTITPHLPPAATATGAAIVICPGGGYVGQAIDKEGHDIARWLNGIGVAGFVLKYRLPRPEGHVYGHAIPKADALRAIRLVRERADEWRVDPRRVGIMGFSAGGHLASTAGTQFADPAERPDFLALIYAVLSSDPAIAHRGSFRQLLGENPPPDLLAAYSSERRVTWQTPPAFLLSTSDDFVKPENSLRFYEALRREGIPAELHVYERGGHGYGIRDQGRPVSTWHHRFAAWLRDRGLLAMPDRQRSGFHLYLLIGQSNMAGRGEVDERDREAHPRVFALGADGRWQPARDPIHFDKKSVGVGLGRAFGIAMAEADPDARIGLIPCAVGGTSITRWRPGARDPATGTRPYDDALGRARRALRDGVLKGILWHQGESDAGDERRSAAYAEDLRRLLRDLRKDLQCFDAPFVGGELGRWSEAPYKERIHDALRGLHRSMPPAAFVSSTGLSNEPDDPAHFDAASLRELGRRYARAMQALAGRGR